MQLPSIRKNKKRVARGGKRGTTAGRGTKGQKSRSGHVIRPAERDLILKLPKQRGFRNKPKSPKALTFNLGDLSQALKGHSDPVRVNHDTLKAVGLISKRCRGEVKILGEGTISVVLTVPKGITVSKSAAGKITAAGGTIDQ
jgi:large subunit ribosomal protein L15